jgi:hypothetical protein
MDTANLIAPIAQITPDPLPGGPAQAIELAKEPDELFS